MRKTARAVSARGQRELVTTCRVELLLKQHSTRPMHVADVAQRINLATALHMDIYKCLLDFRDSPISGLQVTPAQLLMGHRLKSILPVSSRKLMPQPTVQGRDELVARQQQMACYYNRGKRELPSLQPGESCRIR
ncbi:hypothetical protein DPX16_23746 [Anabarilius grahami]|uniref:Uncharacterized protein n=1 Tax=Anabarilius grahami TaxID=495550 RepID=A0A3N0YHQ0_ANAGA|nr:hypothetical protein DPX16_23746 [Anabarilius grahami]